MTSSAVAYQVVRADLERDRDTILGVWAKNLSSVEKLREKFEWHFVRNPYGAGRCWLLLAGGQPAGTSALGMRAVQAYGENVCAGVACDLAVDQAHRFLQPALLLQRAVVSAVGDGVRLVYGIPNDRGAAPIKRVGYGDCGQIHRYAKAVRVAPYLVLRAPWVPGFAGRLADGVLGIVSRLRHGMRRGYRSEVLDSFDSRFDELWERERRGYLLIGIRDARYLNWRYAQCPLRSYGTVALMSGARLSGYIVYFMDGTTMCWVDFFVEAEPAQSAGQLIAAGLRQALGAGAASISIHGSVPDRVLCELQAAGFHRRTRAAAEKPPHKKAEVARSLLVYAGAETRKLDPWYMTAGDEPYN